MGIKWLALIFSVVVLAAFLFFKLLLFQPQEENAKMISLGSIKITAEEARTKEQRTKGLSGRANMPKDRGMFFVFEKKELYSFWMREMNFPLDFIWLDGKKVVEITENVPHPKNNEPPVIVAPKVPVDGVLEINAGTAGRSGVKIGEEISIEK